MLRAKPNRKNASLFPVFNAAKQDTPEASPQASPGAEPVAKAENASDTAAARPPLAEDTAQTCASVLERLTAFGQDAQSFDRRALFNAGIDTLSWMEMELAEVANDDQPHLARLQHLTEEATDLIHLLKMEDTDTAAVDAATILLQIKRNTQAVLAA